MTNRIAIIFVLMTIFASSLLADNESLQCDIGPVDKKFGGTDWIVYSCVDSISFVVVSVKVNPAAPFVFISSLKDGVRTLYGEGNGSKEASAAALEDLKLITQSEEAVGELIAETIAVSYSGVRDSEDRD